MLKLVIFATSAKPEFFRTSETSKKNGFHELANTTFYYSDYEMNDTLLIISYEI